MKNLICLLVLIISSVYASRGEVTEFQNRLDNLKEYQKEVPEFINELKELKEDYSNYQHQNIIEKDQNLLDQNLASLGDQLKTTENANSTFLFSSVQKRIDELDKYVSFQEGYEDKLQAKAKIENEAKNYSKRFQKYIQAVQERKYTKQDILRAMLFKEEKELAQQYAELNSYLVREANTFDYNKKQIKELIPEIEDSFKYPNESYSEIENAKKVYAKKNDELNNLKKLHDLVQYDVTLGTWESGLFSCKESRKPEYWRFENYPDLVALVNDGQIKSVLKIDPENPQNKEYAYKCGNYGMFGGCLENTKKKLCEIDSDCNQTLEKMEESYDHKKFFGIKKNEILNELKEERDLLRSSPYYINFLTEWDKMDRLGELSVSEYNSLFDEIFTEAKNINESSVEKYLKTLKSKLEVRRDKLLKSHKDDDSQKAINYFINDSISFFEKLLDQDKLQVIASKHCYDDSFCENYKLWDEKAKLFDKVSPIENLVENECPRLVLRLNNSNKILESYNCEVKDSLRVPSAIEQLNLDINSSLKMLDN